MDCSVVSEVVADLTRGGSGATPFYLMYDAMQDFSFRKDIESVRNGLLSDFQHIAEQYQSLQPDYPVQYRQKIISEMQRYADELKAHPAYHRFCQKYQLHQDEFIQDILHEFILKTDSF